MLPEAKERKWPVLEAATFSGGMFVDVVVAVGAEEVVDVLGMGAEDVADVVGIGAEDVVDVVGMGAEDVVEDVGAVFAEILPSSTAYEAATSAGGLRQRDSMIPSL